jgi:hypothetical protein
MRFIIVFCIVILSTFSFGQSITITSPNGGEFYNANSSQTITWNTTGSVGLLDLYYTTDNGVNWTLYASGINSASGSYGWTVPNNPSNVCLIRLEAGVIADTSDAVFSISFNNNSLTVGSPNGGEIYTGGSTQNITWSTSGPVASLQLYYSTDNGSNWTLIASGISAFLGTYSWSVPNVSSTNCLVRLTDGIATDESNANFTINGVAAGSITVLNPNGGESMVPGNNYNITWTTVGTVNPLSIYYSIDNGANWTMISSGETGSSYIWQVPNAPSTNCLIRLEDGTLADNSDAVFTINPDPTAITLISPNGGEVLQGFDTFNITWDTVSNSYIDSVEISFKESLNFAPHFATVKNTGSYAWRVPNLATTTAKINVKLQGYLLQDSSDLDFTINPIAIQLSNPNGGEILVGGDPYQINWLQTGNFSGVDIYQSLDSGLTYTPIITGVIDTFYVWNAPNVDSANCIIKIDYQGLISDTSDLVFAIEYFDSSAVIVEFNADKWLIFPNPTSGEINVQALKGSGLIETIQIYGVDGALIQTFSGINKFDVSMLPNGIYFVRINGDGITPWMQRVVVNK